jgi:hypothetical protein
MASRFGLPSWFGVQNSQAPRAIRAAAKGIRTTIATSASLSAMSVPRLAPTSGTVPRAGRTPANERHHRSDLEGEDDREETHLDPEEPVTKVEVGLFLQPPEDPQKTRRDPEQRGDSPGVVRLKETSEETGIGRCAPKVSETKAAGEHGSKAERQRQDVQVGERGASDHRKILLNRPKIDC